MHKEDELCAAEKVAEAERKADEEQCKMEEYHTKEADDPCRVKEIAKNPGTVEEEWLKVEEYLAAQKAECKQSNLNKRHIVLSWKKKHLDTSNSKKRHVILS